MTYANKLALADKSVPHGPGILIGRLNGLDTRFAAIAHGSMSESEFMIEAGKLKPLFEDLIGFF